MRVVIRVDASVQMGTGHVMRCLTLAQALKKQGADVAFICRLHEGHLIDVIQQQGFEVYPQVITRPANTLKQDESSLFHADWLGGTQAQDAEQCRPILQRIQPDWLIVDHYAIDRDWHAALSGCYRRLMVIDDLTDRAHLADLLLNQNYGANPADYRSLVGAQCRLLTGTHYALLREEFAQWRALSLARRQTPVFKHLLITLGGADADNVTGAIIEQLATTALPESLQISVVMGASTLHKARVIAQARRLPWQTEVRVNVTNMAELMCQADLAIGAAGATTWERCCLGLPTIQFVIAFNQRQVAEQLAQAGLVKTVDNVAGLPLLLADAPNWMAELSHKSAQICDGLGCQRVVAAMFE
ncbi:MAG: UDP-2,4-diacetamido-2,4,6-trideoxy-beta-L-altropyranose hydrolase [Thiomicrospira sp.]